MNVGRKEVNVLQQPVENKAALKTETGLKKISGNPKDPGKSTKARFRVFGEEIIDKEVKSSGNSGRVYLPLDWVGKVVKIIRID